MSDDKLATKAVLGSIEQEITREESIQINQIQRKEEDAVFIEENPQKILDKLLNFKESHYKERLAYTKHLSDLILLVGEDAILNMGTIIQFMLDDADEIKKNFLTQLPSICNTMKTKPNSYELIKQHIVPALQELLKSNNYDVKEQAGNQISMIAVDLTESDRGNLILTQVIQMAHDDASEENVLIAIKLFGQLAGVFGTELSESFIALEILSKGEDSKYQVRKEAVLQLANICKALSKEFIKNRLLPFFSRKTEDRAWQTRKACVDIIVNLAQALEQEHLPFLTIRMLALLDDTIKWVKQAAYKKLGQFIGLFAHYQGINEKLLEYYIKMIDTDVREFGNDNEMIIECAFNFPAILYVFGAKKWPTLSKVFQKLVTHKDKRVRMPLASSLHEIAKILGSDIAYNELLKILEQLMEDQQDEIKYGAIQNLGKFFDAIDESKRGTLIDILLIIQKDQKKWRIRELIGKQIGYLVQVFDIETVFQIILPMSTKLCNDNVSQVRKIAAKQIHSLYSKFQTNETYQQILIQNVLGFGISNMYSQRQSFVHMCSKLMNFDTFSIHFLEQFITTGQDPIINVRISVAKVLKKHIYKYQGIYKDQHAVMRQWQQLVHDPKVKKVLNLTKFHIVSSPASDTNPLSISQQQEIMKLQKQQSEIQESEQKILIQELEEEQIKQQPELEVIYEQKVDPHHVVPDPIPNIDDNLKNQIIEQVVEQEQHITQLMEIQVEQTKQQIEQPIIEIQEQQEQQEQIKNNEQQLELKIEQQQLEQNHQNEIIEDKNGDQQIKEQIEIE